MPNPKTGIFAVSFKPLPPLPDRVEHPAGNVLADDGPGVPPEHRERIFERGFSVRTTASPGNEGSSHSGIGRWMARRYLQALGGGIRAENRPGRGLLMRIELPLTGVA